MVAITDRRKLLTDSKTTALGLQRSKPRRARGARSRRDGAPSRPQCHKTVPKPWKRSTDARSWARLPGRNLSADVPAEAQIFRLVDDTHASAAKFAEHAVVRDGFLDHFLREVACGAILGDSQRRVNAAAATSANGVEGLDFVQSLRRRCARTRFENRP